MHIEEVHAWVQQRIAAHPSVEGMALLVDDASYPKAPGREQALGALGFCITVWQVESDGLIDETQKGAASRRFPWRS